MFYTDTYVGYETSVDVYTYVQLLYGVISKFIAIYSMTKESQSQLSFVECTTLNNASLRHIIHGRVKFREIPKRESIKLWTLCTLLAVYVLNRLAHPDLNLHSPS